MPTMVALNENEAPKKIVDLTADSSDSEHEDEGFSTRGVLRNVWHSHQHRNDSPNLQSPHSNAPVAPGNSLKITEPPVNPRKRQKLNGQAPNTNVRESPPWRVYTPLVPIRPRGPAPIAPYVPMTSSVAYVPNGASIAAAPSPPIPSFQMQHRSTIPPSHHVSPTAPPVSNPDQQTFPSLAAYLQATEPADKQNPISHPNRTLEPKSSQPISEAQTQSSSSLPESHSGEPSPKPNDAVGVTGSTHSLPERRLPEGRPQALEAPLANDSPEPLTVSNHRSENTNQDSGAMKLFTNQNRSSESRTNTPASSRAGERAPVISARGDFFRASQFQDPPADSGANSFTRARRNAIEVLNGLPSHLSLEERTSALVRDSDRVRDSQIMQWTPEEHALLIHAKEELQLRWADIHLRFFTMRGKDWHVCQTQYSQALAVRKRSKPYDGRRHRELSLIQTRTEIGESSNTPQDSSDGRARDPNSPSETDETLPAPRAKQTRIAWVLPRAGLILNQCSILPPSNRATQRYLSRLKRVNKSNRTAAALASGVTKLFPIGGSIHKTLQSDHQQIKPIRSLDMQRPYLSFYERQALGNSFNKNLWRDDLDSAMKWHGQVLHVDFMDFEIRRLVPFILQVMDGPVFLSEALSLELSLSKILQGAKEHQITKIVRHAQSNMGIFHRTNDSLRAFLHDLASQLTNPKPSSYQLSFSRQDSISPLSTSSLLRRRELGLQSKNIISSNLRATVEDTLGPHLAFTGTSGDVNTVSWAPNGDNFAAGSAALTDPNSMQYNAKHNLLFGSIDRQTLIELPHHATRRERTETGPNSSHSMYASQDPLLFQSVTAVQFTPDGDALVSSGYDHSVRVWDLRPEDGPICKWNFQHQAKVDVLAVNSQGLIATGSKRCVSSSIRILKYDLDAVDASSLTIFSYYSPRAREFPAKQIHPSCLRWGNEIYDQQRYLLCGFSSKLEKCDDGQVCLWDIRAAQPTAIVRGTRSIFDIAWSPSTFGRFAVASTKSQGANRGIHSIIKLYDSRFVHPHANSEMQVDKSATMLLECPALDMNDILFNPADEFLISAGCTDGSIYTWDLRQPDDILHKFSHGKPVLELEAAASREEVDTGVRFLAWGGSRRSLYTGSSDGVVQTWDPYRSNEDACLGTIAQLNSGVMSGSFSPDHSSLLLGEVNGSIMILTTGRDDMTARDYDTFKLQPANNDTLNEVYGPLKIPSAALDTGAASGRSAARDLIDSGQIEIRPFGDLPFRQAVQGPKYDGPFDLTEQSVKLRYEAEQFQARFKRLEISELNSKQAMTMITEEEQGDAGHWRNRIPHSVRTKTNKSAWPYQVDLNCFRCDAPLEKPEADSDQVYCSQCGLSWRVDVLGYTLMAPLGSSSSSDAMEFITSPETLQTDKHRPSQGLIDDIVIFQKMEDDRAELQNVEDHYHDLWEYRPVRPMH